ncbi:MAG: methyl-accepting chemotaxis protein [Lachnospiraceae bacterium]|nr:methyl-accepting chemotaxis protein [Lachnospiraceae bacterium]
MKKRFPIKLRLILSSVAPTVLIALVLTIVAVTSIKSGMEKEVEEGLLCAAQMYLDIAENQEDPPEGEVDNSLEDEFKSRTGYDFTWFDGDTRSATSIVKDDGTRPIGTKASDAVINAVLNNNQTFTSSNTDVAGKEYAVAYVPYVNPDTGKVEGMAFAGKPRASIQSMISSVMIKIIVISIILIAVAVVAVLYISTGIVNVIKLNLGAVSVLAEGEFKPIKEQLNRNDEFGDMIHSNNEVIEHLQTIVGDIKGVSNNVNVSSKDLAETADQISHTTDDVSNAVQEIAKGATEQADVIQKATENINILSDAIQSVADNAENLAGTAAVMNDNSQTSADKLEKLSNSMKSMENAMGEISASIKDTNDAVADIAQKVDGITSIASQTNLLALNASIEAARAGEAGRGFAVVAEEIGKLATESAETADEIRTVMDQLTNTSENAIKKSAEVEKINGEVSQVLSDTVDSINQLIDGVSQTVDGVNNISGLSEECAATKVSIVDAMDSLSAISEENAASTEETSASMEELNATVNVLAESARSLGDISNQLDDELSFFK